MKNKILFTLALLTAGYAVTAEVAKENKEVQAELPWTFNRLGLKVRLNTELSPKLQTILSNAGTLVAFALAVKYAPRVVTPGTTRAGLITAAGLYATKLYKKCSWSDLAKSAVEGIKKITSKKEAKQQ